MRLTPGVVLLFVVGCQAAEANPELERSPHALHTALSQSALGSADRELDSKAGVLVELFTSEGCSSCPPADTVLADLVQRADVNGEQVIPIAFHVDYWNDLGWADPYSLADSSDRQHWYAQVFRTSRIYTPQMIVAGTHAFVGSNRDDLDRNLHEVQVNFELQPATLRLAGGQPCADCAQKNQRAVSLRIDALSESQALLMALVQQHATSKVTRGENEGRTLEHRNVVRAFTVRDRPNRINDWRFTLPPDAAQENFSVVAFLQDIVSGHIKEARRWALPKPVTQ